MTTRRAACSCGQLTLTIAGEPSRISMCHCLECQRRTGAVLSNQARFRREQIAFAGKSTAWTRTAESGNALTFHFCPTCGSTVYWEGAGFPGLVAVAIGTLADPTFPAPTISVWEECRHPWVLAARSRQRAAWPSRGEGGHPLTCHPGIRRSANIRDPAPPMHPRYSVAPGTGSRASRSAGMTTSACRILQRHPVQVPR